MSSGRDSLNRASLVGSRIGRYDIVAEIGSGGMASVYLARSMGSAGFKRLVAIKAMHRHLSSDEAFVEMFMDEARVASTIHHPNVVAIMDVGVEDDLIFLIMEYVEGDSFSNVEKVAVQLRRRIPLKIVLRVVLDALAGLHNAHELTNHDGSPLKIVHRDVSPQNIMVGIDGNSRIVDFGIARAESRITTTKVGMIKGKLNFMAPEQLRGAPLDRRVDVFGMGVTLWEAVTLRRLFSGDSDVDVARKIISGEYPRLLEIDGSLPPVVDEIVRKALAPVPEDRFATAAELSDAIEGSLRSEIATHREVAAFMAGVAAQKIDRERKAVREFGGGAPKPTPRTPPPDPDIAMDDLDEEREVGGATVVDSPEIRMAVLRATAGRAQDPPRTPGVVPERPRRPTLAALRLTPPKPPTTTPPPLPGSTDDYDDDHDTAMISRKASGALAPAQPFAPASRRTTGPQAALRVQPASPPSPPSTPPPGGWGAPGPQPAGRRTRARAGWGGGSLPGMPGMSAAESPDVRPAPDAVTGLDPRLAPGGVYGMPPLVSPAAAVVPRATRGGASPLVHVFLVIAAVASVSAAIWYVTHR